MSRVTYAMMLAWVEATERATDVTAERLAVYAGPPVSDPTVPPGWLRVLLHPHHPVGHA